MTQSPLKAPTTDPTNQRGRHTIENPLGPTNKSPRFLAHCPWGKGGGGWVSRGGCCINEIGNWVGVGGVGGGEGGGGVTTTSEYNGITYRVQLHTVR